MSPAGPRRPVSMAARPAYLPAGSRPWLQPRHSDLAATAVVAAQAAAGSRCDLFSGRADGSEAHAETPLQDCPPRACLCDLPTPARPQTAGNYVSQEAERCSVSLQGRRNYISRNDLQCAGASMRYSTCCNSVVKAPDPGLHFPEGPAARMSRKAVALGAVTFARRL